MKRILVSALLVSVLCIGCASAPNRPVPSSFDLVVLLESFGAYSINGTPYTFAGVIGAVASSPARTVVVKGANSMADAVCASAIAVKSGKQVFLLPDGQAKPVVLDAHLSRSEVSSLLHECSA
jgi:hypothetical protein